MGDSLSYENIVSSEMIEVPFVMCFQPYYVWCLSFLVKYSFCPHHGSFWVVSQNFFFFCSTTDNQLLVWVWAFFCDSKQSQESLWVTAGFCVQNVSLLIVVPCEVISCSSQKVVAIFLSPVKVIWNYLNECLVVSPTPSRLTTQSISAHDNHLSTCLDYWSVQWCYSSNHTCFIFCKMNYWFYPNWHVAVKAFTCPTVKIAWQTYC